MASSHAPQNTQVKICGIRTPDAMTAALEGGANFVGLVFHPASPRYVEIEVATYLSSYIPDSVKVVGLFVNTPMAVLEETVAAVRIDMLQLHGQETPDGCAALKAKFGKPVMKGMPVTDLHRAADFAPACDWLLIDSPIPAGSNNTGGHGQVFDWSALQDFDPGIPWMLAGGLTPQNVGEAIRQTRPSAVDVSSGVEASRGVKDPEKIRAFIEAVRTA